MSFDTDGRVRAGYALNQFKPSLPMFVRRRDHERAFKTIAAAGFDAIEMQAGSGRWEVLGNPRRIADSYGTVGEFVVFAAECGVRVASLTLDPEQPIFELGSFGLDPRDPQARDGLLALARPYLEFLREAGGSTLVARPVGSAWRCGPLSREDVDALAANWSAVARIATELGIRLGLHVDALSALSTEAEVDALLESADGDVGIVLDTAEEALAGRDPLTRWRHLAERVVEVQLKDVHEIDTLDERLAPHAEFAFLSSGGEREIERWFFELGLPGGHVDAASLLELMRDDGFTGEIVVESDQSPDPAGSVMLNGWYLFHRPMTDTVAASA